MIAMATSRTSLSVPLFASLVFVGAVCETPAAAGQSVFTCKDRNGHVISSDRPIAECSDRAMREMSPGGMLRREIAAPLTPEQQAQKDADDRKRRIDEEALREKRRRDSALLAAYSTEGQIDQARSRALADVQDSIRTSRERVAELTKERQSLADETKTYKGKVPPLVQRRVEDNQAAIDDENRAMKMREVDVDRINQRYDEDLRRYRELTASMKPR